MIEEEKRNRGRQLEIMAINLPLNYLDLRIDKIKMFMKNRPFFFQLKCSITHPSSFLLLTSLFWSTIPLLTVPFFHFSLIRNGTIFQKFKFFPVSIQQPVYRFLTSVTFHHCLFDSSKTFSFSTLFLFLSNFLLPLVDFTCRFQKKRGKS